MKYTPKQYAEALYELLKESPHNHKHVLHEFSTALSENNDLRLADEIERYFEILIDEKSGKESLIKTEDKKGGIKIQKADTVVDNTISSRIKKLKMVTGQ